MTKRRLLNRGVLLLILLSGGALVNVAVAWGCAYWSEIGDFTGDMPSEVTMRLKAEYLPQLSPERCFLPYGMNAWGFGRRDMVIGVHYRGAAYDAFEQEMSTMTGLYSGPGGEDLYIARCESSGFPFLALTGLVLRDVVGGVETQRALSGILIPGRRPQDDFIYGYVLPKRLLWPGFAINTIFYAAVLWVMFFAPFALRRRLRIRRGLCPACAYPIGTSPVCTECGKAVQSTA